MGFLSFRKNTQDAQKWSAKIDLALTVTHDDLNASLQSLYAVSEQIGKTRALHEKEIPQILAQRIEGREAMAGLSPVQPLPDFSQKDFLSREPALPYVLSSVSHIDYLFSYISRQKPEPGKLDRSTGRALKTYAAYYNMLSGFYGHKSRIDKNIEDGRRDVLALLPQAHKRLDDLTEWHGKLGRVLNPESQSSLREIRGVFNECADPLAGEICRMPVAGHSSVLPAMLALVTTTAGKREAINIVVDKIGSRKTSISHLLDVAASIQDEESKDMLQRKAIRLAHSGSGSSRRREAPPAEEKRGLSPGAKFAIVLTIGDILSSG